jgi:hypothetical protein
MQTCDHILAKYGVMTNFSIAKKVTKKRIEKLYKKLNTTDEMSEKFQNILKKEILKETQLAMFNNTIPGLITNIKKQSSVKYGSMMLTEKEKKKIVALTAGLIEVIVEYKLGKDEMCLLLIQLVNALGLKDVDFKKFNNTYGPQQSSRPEDDYDDDDDDDYDDYDDDEF